MSTDWFADTHFFVMNNKSRNRFIANSLRLSVFDDIDQLESSSRHSNHQKFNPSYEIVV